MHACPGVKIAVGKRAVGNLKAYAFVAAHFASFLRNPRREIDFAQDLIKSTGFSATAGMAFPVGVQP